MSQSRSADQTSSSRHAWPPRPPRGSERARRRAPPSEEAPDPDGHVDLASPHAGSTVAQVKAHAHLGVSLGSAAKGALKMGNRPSTVVSDTSPASVSSRLFTSPSTRVKASRVRCAALAKILPASASSVGPGRAPSRARRGHRHAPRTLSKCASAHTSSSNGIRWDLPRGTTFPNNCDTSRAWLPCQRPSRRC